MKRIHVVAGVLSDPQGRVLLAQRKSGDPLGGLWEFPGGKVEPPETGEAALARELHEELDISIAGIESLIRVPWDYPGLHVDLDAFRVRGFTGMPRGCQDQALRWLPLRSLLDLEMPAADRPIVTALCLPRTYLITPEPQLDALDGFVAQLERRVGEGATLVQLRARTLPDVPLRALAARCVEIAHRHGARLVINGRLDLCLELGLDGVHASAAIAQRMRHRPVPPAQWFGVSCHDASELARALALGADFVTLGPVRETASHPGARALGWDAFEGLARAFPLPCFALGGLAPSDLGNARQRGAFGIAAIRALWQS